MRGAAAAHGRIVRAGAASARRGGKGVTPVVGRTRDERAALAPTVLVGGVSSVHDALLAAALCGQGIAAESVPPADAAALAAGRALLPRGYPNSVTYLAGALVEHVRRSRTLWPGARFVYLTAAGPFSHHGGDYRLALRAAGLDDVSVLAVPFEGAGTAPVVPAALAGPAASARVLRACVRAALLGDVLVRAGCQGRAACAEPDAVDEAVARARATVGAALRRGGPVLAPLRVLAAALRRLPPRIVPRARPRVRVTGDFFSALTDGDGGGGVLRCLEDLGAAVEPPTVAEGLLYLAWQARAVHPGRSAALARVVRALHTRYADAAGLPGALPDMQALAALADPHYPTHLRGGSGHVEVATFLAAERDASADLVVSVKPFSSITSSAVSDGVLHALARRARRVGFLAIETTGDAQAQIESRLELALDAAARAREERP